MRLWNALGAKLPPAERLPADGLAVEVRTLAGKTKALLLTLPEATGRNEAYYLLALKGPDGVGRLYGLERSYNPMRMTIGTMLIGWLPQGRANYGPGPDPSPERFVAAVEEVLAGERKPMSLMDLRPGSGN